MATDPAHGSHALANRGRHGPRATALRAVLVVALLATAAVHLERWSSGYRFIVSVVGGKDYYVIGPLFLANVVAGVVLAFLVVALRHPLVGLAAAGYGAATLVAFLVDRSVGLFGPPTPLVWHAPEALAVLAELVVVVAAVTWWRVLRRG